MKKLVVKIYFTSMAFAIIATYQFCQLQMEKERIQSMEKIEIARNLGRREGRDNCNDAWERKLPILLDSALQRGMAIQDSIWQLRVPEIRAIADSIGYERGWTEAEIYYQRVLEETIDEMNRQMEAYGEQKFQAGYDQREEESRNILTIRSEIGWTFAFTSQKEKLESDPASRWAIGILSFGLGFLLLKMLVAIVRRPSIKFRIRRFNRRLTMSN